MPQYFVFSKRDKSREYRLAEAEPFRKEKVQVFASHTLDANEMLRQGELLTYLAAYGITLGQDHS